MRRDIVRILLPAVVLVVLSGCGQDEVPDDIVTGVLPSDDVTSVYIDGGGVAWFGTSAGLVSFNGDVWRTYTPADGVAGEGVNGLAGQEGTHGSELWVATNNGVSVHDYTVDGVTSATAYRTSNSSLASDTVMAVTVDVENVRWFATPKGLSVFYISDWHSVSYAALKIKEISCMASAANGWSYMGTTGDGVARYRYDGVDGITGASLIDTDWSGLPDDRVLSVFIVSDTCQWFGTAAGAARHTGEDTREGWTVLTKENGLVSNVVLSIFVDSRGTVWFGTPEGLSSLSGDTWQSYTVEDGLAGNRINAIGEDRQGKIWLATGGGVACYDGVEWIIYKK
jgi:ligand-binding sensor domain-containing protein